MAKKLPNRKLLRGIKLLLLDVDGVMTDGGVYYTERGDEVKKFNIKDGYGIAKLLKSGINVGLVTGRSSQLVARRAQELGITEVHQKVEDKGETFEQIRQKLGLSNKQIAYLGDDEPDIPALNKAGFAACPADAAPMVRRMADYVCKNRGGEGAVREVVDAILESRSRRT